jgi:hypothetical protein
MSRRFWFAPLCVAVLSAGCFEMFDNTPTNPDPTIHVLGNQWESASPNAGKLLSSCSNFHYSVTEAQSGSTIGAGTFTATCFGVLQVSGTIRATQSGSAENFEAAGTANGGGISNCAISLTGTGTLNGQELILTYSGQTCQGPVSGTEKLKLKV